MPYGFIKDKKSDGNEVDEEFFSEAIKIAKEKINFEEIATVMELLQIKYNSDIVPNESTLETMVDYLIDRTLRDLLTYKEDVGYNSGGFEVNFYMSGKVEILFILTEVVVEK